MLSDANLKLLVAATKEPARLDSRAPNWEKLEHYSNGDFWGESGAYWRGRKPKAGGLDEVQKLFIADDRISAGLNRFVSASLGKDPEWNTRNLDASATGDQSASLEFENALTTWHEDSDLHSELKRFARFALVYGKASLKVYIPDVYADELTASDLPAALEFVHVLALPPSSAGTLRDVHNRTLAHWHLYTVTVEEKTAQRLEVHTPEDVTTYALDGSSLTALSPATANPLFDAARRRRPRFMMLEITRDQGALLTTALLDKQDALNESWTNLKRNDQLAGYRSIITTNASDPVDEDNNPIAWTFGPARVQSLQGVVSKGDAASPEAIATPGVIVVDPVNPLESSIPTINALSDAMLEELDQLWTRVSAVNASGESKRETRRSFDKRVIETAADILNALKFALETAVSLAASIKQNPKEYDRIVINPVLFLDVERGNLEVFKSLVGAYKDNLVSLETLIAANPAVDDASAELERLRVPPRLTPDRADTAVTSARISRQAALEGQGYTPEQAAVIVAAILEEAQMIAGGIAPGSGAA